MYFVNRNGDIEMWTFSWCGGSDLPPNPLWLCPCRMWLETWCILILPVYSEDLVESHSIQSRAQDYARTAYQTKEYWNTYVIPKEKTKQDWWIAFLHSSIFSLKCFLLCVSSLQFLLCRWKKQQNKTIVHVWKIIPMYLSRK